MRFGAGLLYFLFVVASHMQRVLSPQPAHTLKAVAAAKRRYASEMGASTSSSKAVPLATSSLSGARNEHHHLASKPPRLESWITHSAPFRTYRPSREFTRLKSATAPSIRAPFPVAKLLTARAPGHFVAQPSQQQ